LISAAAGLFVDSYEKNPVLLNYGVEEFRFTKPVYPGTSIHIKFTCKEKVSQDTRSDIPAGTGIDIPKGIVKWYVEIIDDTKELAGVGTILTMVAKKNI
jgi:oxepin-CoA hydrolase/3-oxo-5,6-dehydrosuberyl-CoA semialdehyde dehydrogenase